MAEDDTVIPFPGETSLPIPIDRMLMSIAEQSDNLREVIVLARDAAGDTQLYASFGLQPDALYLIEEVKFDLMRGKWG